MYTYYQVYLTPRNGRVTYGTEIEISDYVTLDGLPSIKRAIDSTDFEIGVYTYDDVTIKCANLNGIFNDEFDSRSIFPYGRDKTQVRIVFSNTAGTTITFRGLVCEEATKLDGYGDEIEFRVLSRDSVIKKTQVSAGAVNDGSLASAVIFQILSATDITAVLTISSQNITPNNDIIIENGGAFDDLATSDALNQLLIATNSVMLIDQNGVVTVRDRGAGTTKSVLNLYGPFDIQQRTNIIGLVSYNSGRHRMFNGFSVNDTEVHDQGYILDYGYRPKDMTLDFINTVSTASQVATRLLREFKTAKIECEVDVPTSLAVTADLLDRVALYYPLRIKPIAGTFLPIVGACVIGDSQTPLPKTYGSISIDPNVQFKITAITENPKDFTTRFKLRQTGYTFADGYYNQPGGSIIGSAKIGDGTIGS